MAMTEWFQQLYGPRGALFNPGATVFDQFASGAVPADPAPAVNPVSGVSGGDGGGRNDGPGLGDPYAYLADRGGVPYVNDSLYFATPGWNPDISWKTTAKAYGPYLAGGPLMGGMRMAAAFKNPTQDPVWQEAASQYLAQHAPGTNLADVIREINTLYAADPNAKVFASDTARGVLMGKGHLANAYQEAVLQTGVMQPYQFAKSAQGVMNMGYNPAEMPGYGWSTPTQFSTVQDPVSGQWGTQYSDHKTGTLAGLARAYEESRMTGGGGFFDVLTGKSYAPGERIAETFSNVAEASAKRAASREWMEDILNGKTEDDFSQWQGGNSAPAPNPAQGAANNPQQWGYSQAQSGPVSGSGGGNADNGGGRSNGSGGLAGGAIGGSTRSDGKVR